MNAAASASHHGSPVLDAPPRVLEAGELRQPVVEERDEHDDEDQTEQDPAAPDLDARHLLVVVVLAAWVVGDVASERRSCVRPPLDPLDRRAQPASRRRDPRRAAADALGERGAGEQVDDVVLAQVDEREAQRDRVRPPQRCP